MSMIVLLTSGNSRTARHLIEDLLALANCPNLRVLVRPGSNRTAELKRVYPLLAQPPHAVVAARFMDDGSLASVFRDVTVVVHDVSSVHQHEAAAAKSFIDAAHDARVNHFVLCSVLHPVRTKLANHKINLEVEEYLVESRVNYTILQPAHYMQNVSLKHVYETGNLRLGYSNLVEQGFLDLRDFTQVLQKIVLNVEPHKFATYELVSQNMPYSEVAKILEETMQRNVKCELITPKEYIKMMREGNVIQSEYAEDAMERIMFYYHRWGLTGNSNVLRWLLSREPTTWRQYAADMKHQA